MEKMTAEMAERTEYVSVGGYRVSTDPALVLATCTATCVAVALHDVRNQVGGLLHVVMPGRRMARLRGELDTSYADEGVPLLVEEMIERGASRKGLRAALAGGADPPGVNVGRKNVEMVTMLVGREGIPVDLRQVGGAVHRRIHLHVASGQVRIFELGRPSKAFSHEVAGRPPVLPDALCRRLERLRPVPAVAGALLDAVHRQGVDWTEIGRILSRDPVLALHFFRRCNSAYFGLPGQVSSLDLALRRLGARQVRRICVVVGTGQQADRDPPEPAIRDVGVELHCRSAAVIARCLAGSSPAEAREDAFTGGLLHGAGILALLVAGTASGSGEPPLLAGADQDTAALGSALLERWKLPARLVRAVGRRPAPSGVGEEEPSLAAAVRSACAVSSMLGAAVAEETDPYAGASRAFASLGLANGGLQMALPEITRELDSAGLLEEMAARSLSWAAKRAPVDDSGALRGGGIAG